ncbi:MAG: MFS transporter [Bacteroidota bacterium]
MKNNTRNPFNLIVLVSALGYFVDLFDLQLFNLVSKESLKGIGIINPKLIERYDYQLFLWQMGGMLIGGILWGVLGDKKGRKSVLFGSILLYSLANIANAFVVNVEQYAFMRFITGLGLAGELGAAVTLVSETMHKESRGWGTMLVAVGGALGAVLASSFVGQNLSLGSFANWQVAYLIGGVLGLILLSLRVGTIESGMFNSLNENSQIKRGDLLMIFGDRKRLIKYLLCLSIGIPIWCGVAILMKFSVKFSAPENLNVIGGPALITKAVMFTYLGFSFGDLLSGGMSQIMKSRKKVLYIYLVCCALFYFGFLYSKGVSLDMYYFYFFLLGVTSGYWTIFVTMAAEQFGTNLRATVATTTPNIVRGSVVPIVLLFKYLEPSYGTINSAVLLGFISFIPAFIGVYFIKETFNKELNYHE